MTDLPPRCPTCTTATNPIRDRCTCGRAHCYACGELLADGNPGEAD